MELDLLLRAVLGPAVASALALLALRWAAAWLRAPRAAGGSRSARTADARAGAAGALCSPRWMALLLVAPAIAAFVHQEGGLEWPPLLAFGWLPVAFVVAALVAAVAGEGAPGAPGTSGAPATTVNSFCARLDPYAIAFALVAACSACVLLAPPGLGFPATRLLAAVAIALSASVMAVTARRAGPAAFIAMWGTAACLSAMALLSGFIKLAIILGATSAAVAALAVLACFLRGVAPGLSGCITFAAVLGGSAFMGAGYDEHGIPAWTWALLAASPAASVIALVPAIAQRPRLSGAARALAPIGVAAAALLAGAWLSGTLGAQAKPSELDLYGTASPDDSIRAAS